MFCNFPDFQGFLWILWFSSFTEIDSQLMTTDCGARSLKYAFGPIPIYYYYYYDDDDDDDDDDDYYYYYYGP